MLIEFGHDIRIEEWFFRTFWIARVKLANMAKPSIASQFLAEVVKFLDQLETCVALTAFPCKPIIIPRVFVADLFIG